MQNFQFFALPFLSKYNFNFDPMNHSMFIGCNAPLKVDNHKDEEDGDEVSNCQGGEGRGGVTNGLSRTMNGESEK